MARHRNVRTMNYDEEYEGYDDVYGHSVEDDYSASPSTEHFLYDRNHATQMSAYIQSDIQEEDESIENDQDHSFQRQDSTPGPLKIPPLGEMEQAKLYSCLDMIRDRMGDSFSEQNAVDTILAVNFDSEKALDRLLQNNVPFPKSKPLGRELGPITPAHQDTHSNVNKKINLSQLATMHLSKANPSPKPSLSQLANLRKAQPPKASVDKTPSSLNLTGKPNLAQLAKMNLSMKQGTPNEPLAVCPTLNNLAPKQSDQSILLKPKSNLNLSSALRSKVPVNLGKPRANPTQKSVLVLPLQAEKVVDFDPHLVQNLPSSLGRVITRPGHKSATLFSKFHLKNQMRPDSGSIQPFDFTTLSPDDLIRRRLQHI